MNLLLLKQLSILSAIAGALIGLVASFSYFTFVTCLLILMLCVSAVIIVYLKQNELIGIINIREGCIFGAIIGFIMPLLRFALFNMPPIFPTGIAMAFELATYGAISGLLLKKDVSNIKKIYFALIIAMIVGRISWGIVSYILTQINLEIFITSGFISAIPGIIIQLLTIPFIVKIVSKHIK